MKSAVLALLLLLARCATPPVIDCGATVVAKIPLRVEDRLLVVPAGINGTLVHLLVDTGAERTAISNAVAERLGLPRDPRYVTRSMGVGGASSAPDVRIDELVLGHQRFPVDRLAVGTFKLHSAQGLDADGLLGGDILLAFDMDIDVPDGTLTLYRRRLCPGFLPPWPETPVEIPGVTTRRTRLQVPFVLDGAPGTAILDTGASGSVVGRDLARRLGLNDQTMAGDPTVGQGGVGPNVALARLHRFQQLRIGPTTVRAPVIPVILSESGISDMLIGEDFLQGHRVWLSFNPAQVFVSGRDAR
jgi:predicted aspartyl protease